MDQARVLITKATLQSQQLNTALETLAELVEQATGHMDKDDDE